MKIAKLPTKDQGDWWIAVSNLTIKNSQLEDISPIFVLAFLAQGIKGITPVHGFRVGFALQQKLAGAKYQFDEFNSAVPHMLLRPNARVIGYEVEQRVVATFDAYLNSIYSALEVTMQLAKCFQRDLPDSFRKASTRIPEFSFESRTWLPRFFDIRSELAHLGSVFPAIEQGKIVVEFSRAKRNETFALGKHEIAIAEILQLYPNLMEMLDAWATSQLHLIDPASSFDVVRIVSKTRLAASVKMTAKQIIRLLK